jgi:acetyl-CoA carboxylase carboxyl transferase subunit alpha
MEYVLEFEKPVFILEDQINKLKDTATAVDMSAEISALQKKLDELLGDIYSKLSPWERVLLSRHPLRPHTKDYIEALCSDFEELAGDRCFANDRAIIAGFGHIGEQRLCLIGIEKGRKTNEKIERNFGMPNPEGYRKALRVMKLAASFNIPIVTFIDTPGAYPGIGAEERGQAQAIAENLMEMFDIDVPIVSYVIGEGGSGGALGIAIADKVVMLQYSVYSVISPESCASILWNDPKKAEEAANSLKLIPEMALKLNLVDEVLEEPFGGAHRNPEKIFEELKNNLLEQVKNLSAFEKSDLLEKRHHKFRVIGNSTLNGLNSNECLTYQENQ